MLELALPYIGYEKKIHLFIHQIQN